jgi:hypothetical protein
MKANKLNHRVERLRDYKKIAKAIVDNYDIERLPIVEKMNLLSMDGLTQACSLITECRSPSNQFDANTWFAKNNPVYTDVACAVWQRWALICCLVWEYVTRLDTYWGKKEFQDIYKNWSKNPNTTAFYIAGWSAIEVIHLFLTEIAKIASVALRIQFTTLVEPNFAEKVDRDNEESVEKYEDSIGLGQHLSPAAENWFKNLQQAVEGKLPSSARPDSMILQEYNRLVSQLGWECEQVNKPVPEKLAEPERKKKGIFKRLLKIIGTIIVGIITSVLADILCNFGLIKWVKTIFHNILTHK